MKILILDDFALMRSVLKQALSELGYKEITEAQNTTEPELKRKLESLIKN
ncbi:MAG: hypothetical protein AB7O96_18755 [Pseudobdellovibrionaceae bacterium]